MAKDHDAEYSKRTSSSSSKHRFSQEITGSNVEHRERRAKGALAKFILGYKSSAPIKYHVPHRSSHNVLRQYQKEKDEPRPSRSTQLRRPASTMFPFYAQRPIPASNAAKEAKNRKPGQIRVTLYDLDHTAPPLAAYVDPRGSVSEFASKFAKRYMANVVKRVFYTFLFFSLDYRGTHNGPRMLEGNKTFEACGIKNGATISYRAVERKDSHRVDDFHQILTDITVSWMPDLSITYKELMGRKRADRELVRELRDFISDPTRECTVSDVRARVAEAFDVADPNRIVLIARDGLRPNGRIVGEDWQLRRILRTWLCSRLDLAIAPPRQYLVVQGGGGVVRDADGGNRHGRRRKYILHGKDLEKRDLSVHRVQEDIRSSILCGVQRNWAGINSTYKSAANLTRDLPLFDDNRRSQPLRRSHERSIPWGTSIEFRLRDDLVEKIADAEMWLLLPTVQCIICCDDKPVTMFPHRVTKKCTDHATAVCKPCVEEWIESSLKDKLWNQLKCPECPALLAHADVRLYASRATFDRYDELMTREVVAKEFSNFRWCLAQGCNSGQIHGPSSRKVVHSVERDCPKFVCVTCKAAQCIRHNVPWHSGETCAQYDKRKKQRLQENEKSEAFKEKTSKPCPKCERRVHKYDGCNHITCICGYEWCYLCGEQYVVSSFGILHCRHKDSCREHDLFDELGLREGHNRRNHGFPPGIAPLPPRLGDPLEPLEQRVNQYFARRGRIIVPPPLRMPVRPRPNNPRVPRPPGNPPAPGANEPTRGGPQRGGRPRWVNDANPNRPA